MESSEYLETRAVWYQRYSSVSRLDRLLCRWFGHKVWVSIRGREVKATCGRCWAQQRTIAEKGRAVVELFPEARDQSLGA